jgi:hypothetical protein
MVSYLDQIPPELRDPEKKDEIARFLREAHGDIEDAKVSYLFISDELGFDVEVDDVETVTDEPATETFQ